MADLLSCSTLTNCAVYERWKDTPSPPFAYTFLRPVVDPNFVPAPCYIGDRTPASGCGFRHTVAACPYCAHARCARPRCVRNGAIDLPGEAHGG